MEQFYSTGEVAKLCKVTVRTIQYYDKHNIVSPSLISEGRRRLYSKEDIDRITCVLLYKQFGFTLDEVKDLIDNNSTESILMYINQQKELIKNQILDLDEKDKKLDYFKREISEKQKVTVKNMAELNEVVMKRKDFQRKEYITWILLIGYQIFIFLCFPLFFSLGGIYPVIIILLTVLFLMFLIYHHSSNNAYVCPNCQYKFSLSFLKDAFTLNNGKKGKIIRCPKCGVKTTMKETYKE